MKVSSFQKRHISTLFILLAFISFKTMAYEDIRVEKIDSADLLWTFDIAQENKYIIDLDLYIPIDQINQIPRIREELKRAQKKLNDCSISLFIDRKITLSTSPGFMEFESIEFNRGTPSPHELAFFEMTPKGSRGILLVESLDWTIGSDGTVAIAYGPYILDLNLVSDPRDRMFLRDHMVGYSVLGQHRSDWTLLHELGHSLFNLRHTDDPENIMFPFAFARSPDPNLSESQCEQARSFSFSRSSN